MQPGELRKMSETLAAIDIQLRESTSYGGRLRIKDMITHSGVKDVLANSLVQKVLAFRDSLQKCFGTRWGPASKDITSKLEALVNEKKDLLNPLLNMAGEFLD